MDRSKYGYPIDAPAKDVWDALVNPIKTKQYMFGRGPITDWQPGGSLLWKGLFDGKEPIAVKGRHSSYSAE